MHLATFLRCLFSRQQCYSATLHTASGAAIKALLRRGEMSFDGGRSWQPISGPWLHAFDDNGRLRPERLEA